jgi:hypothetical protein
MSCGMGLLNESCVNVLKGLSLKLNVIVSSCPPLYHSSLVYRRWTGLFWRSCQRPDIEG